MKQESDLSSSLTSTGENASLNASDSDIALRGGETVKTIQYRDGELEEDGKRAVIDVPTDLQIIPVDTPIDLPSSEYYRTLCLGETFRSFIDVMSLPVLLSYDSYRLKVTAKLEQAGDCRLCIYLPKGISEENLSKRGVVMHLHGGGWTISRPETEAPICRYLADNVGVVVVAPDYYKAPRYPYPYALQQCYALLTWMSSGGLSQSLRSSGNSHAKKFANSLDTSRVALTGGSAGSNLAAALTTLTIARPLSHQTHIASLSLLYPALNLAVPYAEKLARVDPERVLPQWASRFFVRAYLPPPRSASDPFVSPALSPLSVLQKYPPTVILTAAYDYLAHEAEAFAEQLRAEGVGVKVRRFEDVGHGFDGIPTWDSRQRMLNSEARDIAWGMIAETVKKTLL